MNYRAKIKRARARRYHERWKAARRAGLPKGPSGTTKSNLLRPSKPVRRAHQKEGDGWCPECWSFMCRA